MDAVVRADTARGGEFKLDMHLVVAADALGDWAGVLSALWMVRAVVVNVSTVNFSAAIVFFVAVCSISCACVFRV